MYNWQERVAIASLRLAVSSPPYTISSSKYNCEPSTSKPGLQLCTCSKGCSNIDCVNRKKKDCDSSYDSELPYPWATVAKHLKSSELRRHGTNLDKLYEGCEKTETAARAPHAVLALRHHVRDFERFETLQLPHHLLRKAKSTNQIVCQRENRTQSINLRPTANRSICAKPAK
jgi:hypothetical protein